VDCHKHRAGPETLTDIDTRAKYSIRTKSVALYRLKEAKYRNRRLNIEESWALVDDWKL